MTTRVTLEEVSEFITDGTHGSPTRTADANGIPLLSAKNVFDGEIRWDEFDCVPPAELEEFQKRVRLKKGDVLMTCVGSIGRVAVWQNERPVVFFRSVAIIRPKPLLLSEFLEYVIRSSDFQSELRRRTKRASQGGIYLKDIKAIPVVLPPLADQHRIVTLLNEAEELRKLRARADERAAELIPALFNEMFGDGRSFPTKPLIEFVDGARGISYGVVQRGNHFPGGVPLLRISDFGGNEVTPTELVSVDPQISNQYKRTIIVGGELIVSIRGTVGRVAVVPKEAKGWNVAREVAVIPLLPGFSRTFLHNYMLSAFAQNFITNEVRGIAQRGINLEDLRRLPVPLPSMRLQEEFAERVTEMRALEVAQAASRQRLDDLFQSMLHRAFEGEL
jgi:type I restriction enzyme S subunit